MDFLQFVCCQERVFLSAIVGQVGIPAEVIGGIDEVDFAINAEIDQEKTVALRAEQGARGRPKMRISEEQINSLLELSFQVPTIADLLGVSIRTVRWRMEEINVSVRASYSNLSDEQLDGIVSEINSGCHMHMPHVVRRSYFVPSPRSLMHIDTNHKLIRLVFLFNNAFQKWFHFCI